MTTPQKTVGLSQEQLKQIHLLILQELDIVDFPPTVQEKMIAEVGQNIFMAVQTEMMMCLPEEEQSSYMKLIKENKPEDATKLVEKYIHNLDEFVVQVAVKTLQEFKEIEAKL